MYATGSGFSPDLTVVMYFKNPSDVDNVYTSTSVFPYENLGDCLNVKIS